MTIFFYRPFDLPCSRSAVSNALVIWRPIQGQSDRRSFKPLDPRVGVQSLGILRKSGVAWNLRSQWEVMQKTHEDEQKKWWFLYEIIIDYHWPFWWILPFYCLSQDVYCHSSQHCFLITYCWHNVCFHNLSVDGDLMSAAVIARNVEFHIAKCPIISLFGSGSVQN